jgi:small-conductance mechanosensitive channel
MRIFLASLIWALALLAGGAWGQGDADVDASLDTAREQLELIKKRLKDDKVADPELVEFRQQLLELGLNATKIAAAQQVEFDSSKARLTELGPVVAGGSEAADVAEQRRMLKKATEQLDARLKLARLLALESGQLSEDIGKRQRARFRDELFERTDSILSPKFWGELGSGIAIGRLKDFGGDVVEAARGTSALRWLSLAALVAGAVVLRIWLGQRLTILTSMRAPSGRVRRSLHAMAQALLAMLVPGAVAVALAHGLGHGLEEGDPLRELAEGVVGAVCFSAYVVGLGQALLQPLRPSWRLIPLPDPVALGLRWYPLALGLLGFVGWFLLRLASGVPLTLASEVAINAVHALLLGALLVRLVYRGEQLRRQAQRADDGPAVASRPLWIGIALFVVWGVLVISLIGIVVGYVALGGFIVRHLSWIAVVLLTTYLLNTLIEDAFSTLLVDEGPGDEAQEQLARMLALRNQAVVLISGVLRVTVWLLAVAMILAPMGEGNLLSRIEMLSVGVSVGEMRLRPTIVLQGLLIFALARAGARLLRKWLAESFLPRTSLDTGMRSSVTTLVGFVGMVLAIGLGLSAAGLELEKVAWIASALSVGIGFGLQAVVSNFVSGLILLAERPVKVGDWVALGGVEGDIRRINVRATEIQMADRSTLIVPNSEFITKVVRNVTHDSPAGLVQIKLPMPLDTDIAKVSEILLRAFIEHADMLEQPPPKVQLDGIDGSFLVFNATGSVGSPRQTYGARSALLLRVLQDLRAADVPIRNPSNLVLREPAPPAPDLPTA